MGSRGPRRITVPNLNEIGQSVGDMAICQFFENGGRPPSWICLWHIWTINIGYLMVFITMQNFVAINAAVSIIWNLQYLACLALKCLFTPPKLGFMDDLTRKWGGISIKPPSQKTHPEWVHVVWAIKCKNPLTGLICRWLPKKRV